MESKKSEAAFVSTLFIVSLGIRFLFLDETAESPLIALNTLQGTDMEGYLRWAALLSRGAYESGRAFWQAPLYPYFLSAVFRISGINVYAAALLQVFLSALTVAFIYLTARETFNRKTAALAGIIACFYGPLIFYSAVLLSETLGIFLIFASMYFLAKSVRLPGKPGFIISGGALLGLSSLARPNFLLFAPFFLLYVFTRLQNTGKAAAYTAFFIASVSVTILPVAVRNYAVSGELVPISANFPETFRLSNSYDSLVLNYREPELPLMPLTSAAFWLHQLRKAVYFWWGFEVPQNVNYYLFAEHAEILNLPLVPFWLMAPAGVTGIYFWWKSQYRREKTLVVFFLASYASVVILYICSRFRLPSAAGLIPFAAYGTLRIFELFRIRDLKKGCLALCFCALFSVVSFPRDHPRIRGTDYRLLGMAAATEGMLEEAADSLEKSIPYLTPGERKATEELLEAVRRASGEKSRK